MAKIAEDDLVPSQNNCTIVFRLTDGQFFIIPWVGATCWSVFNAKDDNNELYRGGYGNAVIREDIGETNCKNDGMVGQATGGTSSTIEDTGAFEVDEWVDAKMYIQRYSDGTIEYATVGENSADELVGEAASFNGVGDSAWTGADPIEDDYYAIIRTVSSNATVKLLYKSPKITINNPTSLKRFIELGMRSYFSGILNVKYRIDDSYGGNIQIDLSKGLTFYGENKWAALSTDTDALLWQAITDILIDQNFPVDAEGRVIEFEIDITTNRKLEITMLSFGFHQDDGGRWS